MKRLLKSVLCLIVVGLLAASTVFACSLAGRSNAVDGHWHHNWTIAPWINYWVSTVMSASASFKSDSGHTIQAYMTVKRGSTSYLTAEKRGSWSLTISNQQLSGDMSNENWGICDKGDITIAHRTVYDRVWAFDNADPR